VRAARRGADRSSLHRLVPLSPAIASGKMAGMADHPHTIDRWDDATGENLVEQIAGVGDYLVALATYKAAVKRWPKDKITLRNRRGSSSGAGRIDSVLRVVVIVRARPARLDVNRWRALADKSAQIAPAIVVAGLGFANELAKHVAEPEA
jgi:hypothetical protein